MSQDVKVGMIGDGINDAPALARADTGFAMGAAGADTASVLKQNIIMALGIKAVFLVLTFTGHATMWMTVFADMGTSLLVVFNGLRLLRK